jgi:hypothetical protein
VTAYLKFGYIPQEDEVTERELAPIYPVMQRMKIGCPHTTCVQKPFFNRGHRQVSAMIFTSLTTITIFVAAMAGVAIASDSHLKTSPMGLPCHPPSKYFRANFRPPCLRLISTDTTACSRGLPGFNNDNDFAYSCGPDGTITSYEACACAYCCIVQQQDGIVCPNQGGPGWQPKRRAE